MYLFLHCLVAIFIAGLLTQVVVATLPVGTARQLVLLCIAAGVGIFCLNRLARADARSAPAAPTGRSDLAGGVG